MRKSFVYRILLCLIIFLLLTVVDVQSTVFAHFLKTDNSIGVILHIDPADDPPAGKVASLIFDFKDVKNKFSLKDCECSVAIVENGISIFSQPLTPASGSRTTTVTTFTFPREDKYAIILKGSPISTSSFQPFSLIWDIDVDSTATSEPTKNTQPNKVIQYSIPIGVIALIVGAIIYLRQKKKTND